LHSQGYARQSGRRKLQVIAGFSRWLHRKQVAANQVTPKQASDYLRSCRSADNQVRRGDHAALAGFLRLLRDHKVIPQQASQPTPTPSQRSLQEYEVYLEKEQSLSLATRINYLPFARQFLQNRFGCGPVDLSVIQATDVLRFVRRAAAQLKGKRVLLMTTALRSFLRFARYRGEVTLDLAARVPSVANWSLSNLPKSLPPAQVEQLLAQARQRSSVVGRRDYAILLLLARLGLRGGEVAGLTLDDIDWEHSRIAIRGKGDRMAQLPLPADVGQALAAYLKERPPVANQRRLFLRVRAPLVGFKGPVAIATVVRHALDRAKIQSPRKGAHLFRHALASAMLQKGSSLSEIGELLRHRSPETTAIYAKVDLRSLRSLALPWPERIR
jgi:site-specific recombinase XerD